MQQKVINAIDAAVFNRPAIASVTRNPLQPEASVAKQSAAAARN